ncbi:MAG TPA: hypothetical protein VKS25_13140 [Solirubrobacteraceae bacterium]|nr:hypothetical protein [Solirubrobacteraceae bacterium]
MGLDVLIGVLAWFAIAVLALGLCRAAARGDVVEGAHAARFRNRRHGSRPHSSSVSVSRAAERAALIAHAVARHDAGAR